MVITCRIRRVDQAKRAHPCRQNTRDPCRGRRVYTRMNDTFVWLVDLAYIIITATSICFAMFYSGSCTVEWGEMIPKTQA